MSLRNFVHVISLLTLAGCLTLSLHRRALIRLHAHDPTQDTCHCEVYKNEKEFGHISGTQKPVSGPVAKNHSKPKNRRTQCDTGKCVPFVAPGLSTSSSSSSASMSSHRYSRTHLMILHRVQQQHEVTIQAFRHRETGREIPQKAKTHKNRDVVPASRNRFRHLPEWLKELAENPEDEGVLASRDTPANTSQDSDSDRFAKVVSRKRSLFTHFSKEIARCAREPKLRGLLAGSALVMQYLEQITKFTMNEVNLETITDTQSWYKISNTVDINSYVPKPKLLRRRKGGCESFSNRLNSRKSFQLDNSVEFGKSCEEFSWNLCTSTPHRSETNGIAERTVRRIQERTSVLLFSGMNEKWWADSMECFSDQRNVQDLMADGKHRVKSDLDTNLKDQ